MLQKLVVGRFAKHVSGLRKAVVQTKWYLHKTKCIFQIPSSSKSNTKCAALALRE